MQRAKKHDICYQEIEPDHELLLWEEWIKVRKDEITKLGQKLNRPPADLVMNLVEKVREEKEWKTALEHAQIEKKPAIRGTLWEQPLRLKQRCYCEPVYEVQRTPAELGKPKVIEHISVPTCVLEVEKGVSGKSERIVAKTLNAEFVNYRKNREALLKEKIKKIDPFRPIGSGLIVKGCKPKTPPKKMPPVPSIEVTPPVSLFEDMLCTVYAVRVNNTVIYKHIPGQTLTHLEKIKKEPWHESCTSWSYYFNVPVKRAGRCKIFLHNLGTVTLRYCWKKIKKTIPYIPEDIYEQVFFFNKNEDVLNPGQSKEILFTFLSDKPGIYSEFWELSFCNICFYDTMYEKLSVNFHADSVENSEIIRKKFETLNARINKKAINNIVSDIINGSITKATSIEPQKYPYKWLFLEAELFVMKNPVCYYHQTELQKMKNMYTEMAPGQSWDLSITSWREKMLAKGFDERMKYYELLKMSHADLLKPWYEGDDLLRQKYRAMNWLFGQMADKFDKKYDQLIEVYGPYCTEDENAESKPRVEDLITLDPMMRQKISNLFYIHAYDYLATTIEMCAGVLSSLDLNRWIEFDFCRW